jgi:hypothetical protein
MSRLAKWSLPALVFAVVVALAGARAGAQEGAADKAKMAKVTGVIHDEEGKPVANVTVRVTVPQSRDKKEEEKKEAAPAKPQAADDGAATAQPLQATEEPKKPERPKPVAEGKTDAEGKFTIEAPPGKYTIVANLRGQGRVQKTAELKAGETTDVGTLVLKRQAPKKEEAPKKEAAPTT